MSSGVSRVVTGSVTGTGSAINVDTVGFSPSYVKLLNVGGLVKAEWTKEMADASALKQVTAGTISLITSNGVTPRSAGFTIGADADINASGELIRFVAFE